MSYAIRIDGLGWRAVSSSADIDPETETYSATQPAPITQSAGAVLKQQAQAALNATDLVCLRCYKSGVAYPTDWQTYTTALRAIVNGSDTTSTTLPTQPAYPAGT